MQIEERYTSFDSNSTTKQEGDTSNNFQYLGDIVYLNVKGAGTTVDIYYINVKASTQLTPPVFKAGKAALNLFTYVGSAATINYDFSATDTSWWHKMDSRSSYSSRWNSRYSKI